MEKRIKLMLSVIVIVVIAGFIWSMGGFKPTSTLDHITNLEVGKTYIKSSKLDKEDPFTPPQIDTIKIVDKKDGYVKWTKREWMRGDSVAYWVSSPERYIGQNVILIK